GHIQRIEFILDPLPLLRKTVVLPQLDVDGANLALQRRADESNNWTFGTPNQPAEKSRWRFVPGLLRIHRSTVQLDDAKRQLVMKIEADSNDKGVGWSLTGKLNGAPLQAHGAAGSVLALQDKKNPYPIEAHIALGDTRIDAVGTLTDPTDLAALD